MNTDRENLSDKLRRLSELALRGATPGERSAARAGVERIKARIAAGGVIGEREEVIFSFTDPWSRRLFIGLCRRHGLKPFRRSDQAPGEFTLLLDAKFVETVFWPEYNALAAQLDAALDEATDDVIDQLLSKG